MILGQKEYAEILAESIKTFLNDKPFLDELSQEALLDDVDVEFSVSDNCVWMPSPTTEDDHKIIPRSLYIKFLDIIGRSLTIVIK